MTSVAPTPTTTLIANLRRLALTHTADGLDDLIARATRARWSPTVLLEAVVQAELDARASRRLERQLHAARLGRFKALADFEWDWPKQLHRATVDRVWWRSQAIRSRSSMRSGSSARDVFTSPPLVLAAIESP